METETSGRLRDAIAALIQGLRISEAGMIEAAGKVADRELARWYYQMANNREVWAQELGPFTAESAAVEEELPFATQIRELDARLQEAVSDEELYVVLGDTIRTEDAVLDHYELALSLAVDDVAVKTLRHQHAEICEAAKTLVKLRDKYLPAELRAGHRKSRTAQTLRSQTNEHSATNCDTWSTLGDGWCASR